MSTNLLFQLIKHCLFSFWSIIFVVSHPRTLHVNDNGMTILWWSLSATAKLVCIMQQTWDNWSWNTIYCRVILSREELEIIGLETPSIVELSCREKYQYRQLVDWLPVAYLTRQLSSKIFFCSMNDVSNPLIVPPIMGSCWLEEEKERRPCSWPLRSHRLQTNRILIFIWCGSGSWFFSCGCGFGFPKWYRTRCGFGSTTLSIL